MLEITRTKGQTIEVDGGIVIMVLDAKGQVRLGIAAPKQTKILRGELRRKQGVK